MKWITLLIMTMTALNINAQDTATNNATSKPIRVACVGDSLTVGLGMEDPATQAYPAQLQGMLGEGWEVRGFAASGYTASRNFERSLWDHPEFKAAQEWEPDVVVICLGTNDSWPSRWEGGLKKDFSGDLKDMAKVFIDLPSKPRCYLALPPPLFIDDEVQKKIMTDEINANIRKVARELGIFGIDFYTPLLDHPEYFRDKVHPHPSGAEVMAQTVKEALLKK